MLEEFDNQLEGISDLILNRIPILKYSSGVVWANKMALNYFQVEDFSQIKGKDLLCFMPDYQDETDQSSRDVIDSFIQNTIKTGGQKKKLNLIDLNNNRKFAEVQSFLYEADIVITIKDLSEYYFEQRQSKKYIDKLERTIETGTDLIWEYDVNRGMITTFPSIFKILGYNNNNQIFSIDEFHEYFVSDEQFWDMRLKMRAIMAKQQREIHCEFQLKGQGKTLWFKIHGKANRFDKEKNVFSIGGNMMEITKEKANEAILRYKNKEIENQISELRELNFELQKKDKALSNSERNYRNIYNRSLNPVFIQNIYGKILDINNAGWKLLGYDGRNDLIGKFVKDISAPGQIIDTKKLLMVINSNKPTPLDTFEWQFVNKQGVSFWTEVTIQRMEIDNEICAMAFLKDINRRKMAETELVKMAERYNLAMQASNDGIWQYDTMQDKFIFNPAFYKITGLDNQNPDVWSELQKLFSIDKIRNFLNICKNEGSTIQEFTINTRKGKKVIIIKAKYFENHQINSFKIAGTISDITALKKDEETIFEQSRRLYVQNQELIKMTEDLKDSNNQLLQANQKAQESDNLKNNFLKNLSHEVRTPLHLVVGFAERLIKDNIDPQKKKQYFSHIKSASDQLISIIEDMIEMSKLETDQVVVNLMEFEISQVVKDICNVYSLQADKDIEFKWNISPQLENLMIRTDRTKLYQIYSNLVSNAFKYTKKGHVYINFYPLDNEIVFEVSDTGIGIKDEYKTMIFNKFVRIDNGNEARGNGLGLSIAYQYAILLGGKIELESQVGVGSTFSCRIPK